ncbi:MAG: aminomethyl-transferring glycine dehydrogenase [Candidatus Symbiobacter sp.]|nr:aminomethyl-transferring glycine dehydrogenase [Candidatus Symbiobacter sp.]
MNDKTATALPAKLATPEFHQRHIGPAARDQAEMLKTIGAASMEQLMAETLPAAIRQATPLDLGPGLSETEALAVLRELAQQNQVKTSLIGQGYYNSHVPGVIQRNILENPAWYTAYTPYQPEISQGRLEALLNYQTMVTDLTGLDLANASLLDEATAAAEAMMMAERAAPAGQANPGQTKRFFIDENTHPQTIAVLATRAEPVGVKLVIGDPSTSLAKELANGGIFGALLSYPGSDGAVVDYRAIIAQCHAKNALVVMATDLLALTLLTPPGELGADIAVGSSGRFGVPVMYGGPHAAFMACRDQYKRIMPGRLVGVTIDARGSPAYRLALQTREQHIRREKATSNICTAQVLLAVMASMYAVYHGPDGLRRLASRVHYLARVAAAGLQQGGIAVGTSAFFDTVWVENLGGGKAQAIMTQAVALGINLRQIDAAKISFSLDETTTPDIIGKIWQAFGITQDFMAMAAKISPQDYGWDKKLTRGGEILSHPVFHAHHSETEMLRYIRRLSDRDLALDRAMIPLGSCTMKLNATSEMIPVTWPEFTEIHPFAPSDQAQGYHALVKMLSEKLCTITGYDAISLQPNSGAQGEYAGLLAIRAWHQSRKQSERVVCLIPASAHGTNPASAQMVGMEVVVVACDAQGNVDMGDLRAKLAQHGPRLAAIMITYPSTHGVFEEQIRTICDLVHHHGGQVYLDGANMNAQVGLARPGDYGADCGHLNLHKTFCIPHGGGGPGVGPIGVKAHLAPFLPSTDVSRAVARSLTDASLSNEAQSETDKIKVGPVAAAPFGSAGILPIPLMYILMMAGDGLRRATECAILSANYIATRLAPHYPLLYQGAHGRIAHECILDPRGLKESSGVTVDDIAKRLIDYGFHAPTMSFPVPGTLMIEPTESESKAELDRFCDAMIAIRDEIRRVEAGVWPKLDNPLSHAPHTVFDIADDEWTRPYSRQVGCFPTGSRRQDKYWASVNRIDHIYGDRNLVCTCPPLSAYGDNTHGVSAPTG